MTEQEFKDKVKNLFALIGAFMILCVIVGQVITIVVGAVFVYIYFKQKDVYIMIKNKYNLVISRIYQEFGKNIDLEKYRK
mgnify:FL=1